MKASVEKNGAVLLVSDGSETENHAIAQIALIYCGGDHKEAIEMINHGYNSGVYQPHIYLTEEGK